MSIHMENLGTQPYNYYYMDDGTKINLRSGSAAEADRIVQILLREIEFYKNRASYFTPMLESNAMNMQQLSAVGSLAKQAEISTSAQYGDKKLLLL